MLSDVTLCNKTYYSLYNVLLLEMNYNNMQYNLFQDKRHGY